jgi:methylenetetrahydrofolate--tRNA-(uracil-5-)-methyltransferase
MHRNTFINSPKALDATYQSKERKNLFFAGQMTGVEGYVESAASGLIAGINAARMSIGQDPLIFPAESAMGSMARYITETNPKSFQPMNVNFGLFPQLPVKIRDKNTRNLELAHRALETIQNFKKNL